MSDRKLTVDQVNELLRCALNARRFVRPSGKRAKIVATLIRFGLMQAAPADVYNAGTLFVTLRAGASATLTEAGWTAILDLDPQTFARRAWWPLPDDVRAAQERAKLRRVKAHRETVRRKERR